jgi:hypothetical protein
MHAVTLLSFSLLLIIELHSGTNYNEVNIYSLTFLQALARGCSGASSRRVIIIILLFQLLFTKTAILTVLQILTLLTK